MPHADLNLNPGNVLPAVKAQEEEKPEISGAEKLLAIGDFLSAAGAAIEGKAAPPSAFQAFQNTKLREQKLKQEKLIFEQQQFVTKLSNMDTFLNLRKNIPADRHGDFDKQAVSFIGDTDKRFGELYHFAVESQGNTEIIGDILGGGFEQDPVLQQQLQQRGPSGFIDWTLGDGKAYIGQLKTQKFGPSAKSKIGAIVSDLKANIPDALFKRITKDGITTVGEIDAINTSLVQDENALALTPPELEYIKSTDGINALQGMGVVSNKLAEKFIEEKKKKQLEAQFRQRKDKKSRFDLRGQVFDLRNKRQVGTSAFDTETQRMGVLLPSGEFRERDIQNEVVTSRVDLKGEDFATSKEVEDFNKQEIAVRSFFDISKSLADVLEKTPAALGNTAAAALFLSGVKTQVQSAANFIGADFDLSSDPDDYSGIWKDLGLLGTQHAAVRSYLTGLAFAGAAAQGLGQKNIDSAKEMQRILRQVGAGAQEIPVFRASISAFQNTLRIRAINTAEVLKLPFDAEELITLEEQKELDDLQAEIDAFKRALGE